MAKEFYLGGGEYSTWLNIPNLSTPMGLTYDNVQIVPGLSDIASRADVDISTQFGPYTLAVPVVAAPMDTASGDTMIRALHELGALGTLPRAESDEEFLTNLGLAEQYSDDGVHCLYAVGMRNGFEQAQQLVGSGADVVLLDVANGGQSQAIELGKRIKGETGATVMVGNIATGEQAEAYIDAGIDMMRVGIGGGSVCKTREVTGVGIPQLSALLDTSKTEGYVVADGGLRTPGDVAKALAVAPVVMVGSMIAGTDEAPGKFVKKKGQLGKEYRGQASKGYMRKSGTHISGDRTAEGVTTWIRAKGPVEGIINDITGGLRSAMSYVGATTLVEFRERSRFILVSPAGAAEAHPHAKRQRHKK